MFILTSEMVLQQKSFYSPSLRETVTHHGGPAQHNRMTFAKLNPSPPIHMLD